MGNVDYDAHAPFLGATLVPAGSSLSIAYGLSTFRERTQCRCDQLIIEAVAATDNRCTPRHVSAPN
jgi:hypothetical protein